MSSSCVFNCEFCAPGVPHICRNCGSINDHRTKDCPLTKPKQKESVKAKVMTSCVLNCGYCLPGMPHVCRECGAVDDHRSANCPSSKPKQKESVKASRSSILPAVRASRPLILPAQLRQTKSVKASDASEEKKQASFDADSYTAGFSNVKVTGVILTTLFSGERYFLVQNRTRTLVRNGHHFIYPGGKLEANQTYYSNSLKELKEEAGISPASIDQDFKVVGAVENEGVGSVNFIIDVASTKKGLPKWVNRGEGAWEVSNEYPGITTVREACHGHLWMTFDEIKSDIGNRDLVYSFALKALKYL